MARYYPNGSGGNYKNPKNQDNPVLGPGIDENVTLENNPFSEWLYGEYDEGKFKTVSIMLHIPILRDYVNYLFDYRADQEYMHRYDLDYEDIHDPRKLKSASSYGNLMFGGINFVSDNVKRLYK